MDGLAPRCRVCVSEYGKARYASSPERRKKQTREWRVNNPEQERENVRKWKAANRERVSEISQRWYAANSERVIENSRRWRMANPKRSKALDWIGKIHRRIRGRGSEVLSRLTSDEAMKILDNLEDKCATCSGVGPFEIDHITPLRLAPDLAYEPSNLQRLCVPCHKAKTKSEMSK